jgi:predicted metal-dependent phosphoesterase TrpH
MNTNTIEKYVEELKDAGWFESSHGKEEFSYTQIQWIRTTLTAVADEARREALEPFKGARNPGEWEDSVWWEGRRWVLEEVRKWVKENSARLYTNYSNVLPIEAVGANEINEYLDSLTK